MCGRGDEGETYYTDTTPTPTRNGDQQNLKGFTKALNMENHKGTIQNEYMYLFCIIQIIGEDCTS